VASESWTFRAAEELADVSQEGFEGTARHQGHCSGRMLRVELWKLMPEDVVKEARCGYQAGMCAVPRYTTGGYQGFNARQLSAL